jgi:RimJ/RimL family protein N-acetyltransferase
MATERLRLRRIRLDDASMIFDTWARDPEVTRYMTWKPHTDISQSIAHVERCCRSWEDGSEFNWIIEDAGEPVGDLAARPKDHAVSFGYLLVPSRWRRGYMSEVLRAVSDWFLEQPEIQRAWAVCDLENAGSARVLENAGFELEGTLRRYLVHPNLGDTARDMLCYSRISDQ